MALHEFLQIKTPHSQWLKRVIEDYGFNEGEDFITKMLKSPGRPKIEASLTVGMAKEVSMTAKSTIGTQVRRYFIECEKRLKQKTREPQQITVGEEAARFYNNMLDRIKDISPTSLLTVSAMVSEKVFGVKIPYYCLPATSAARKSASEIAKELKCTPKRVGMVSKELGLRSLPDAEARMTVNPNNNKEVTSLYYSLEAQRKIKEYYEAFYK